MADGQDSIQELLDYCIWLEKFESDPLMPGEVLRCEYGLYLANAEINLMEAPVTQNLVTLRKVVTDIAAKHRLLAILQLLNEHLGYMSNTDLLQDCLHEIGYGVGRDTLMADVDRLASKGLVESRHVEDVVVATLTNRGQEVAKGISTADDVAKPPPDARKS